MSYEESVFCFYQSMADARVALETLKASDFGDNAISLVASSLEYEVPLKAALNAHDETEHDALIGAGAGGVAGALATMGVVSLAGVGWVIAAGPLLAACVAAGALLGAMAGWGVHKDHVAKWEEKLKQGQVLVVVHGDALLVARAHRILRRTSPLEIHQFSQTDDASDADD